MRTFINVILLLASYFWIVHLCYRLYDFLFDTGELIDPILLNVRQLKQLLDIRGIDYTGYVEKHELATLVKDSADISAEELEELPQVKSDVMVNVMYSNTFNCHQTSKTIYSQIDDLKDTIWLLHVTNKYHLLDENTWKQLQSLVTPFDIRTAKVSCTEDSRFCGLANTKIPFLLLVLPRENKLNGTNTKYYYQNKLKPIMQWINNELSKNVIKISNYDELKKDWLGEKELKPSCNGDVQVLLLTHLFAPPLFFSTLSTIFSGKIKFGILTVKKQESVKLWKLPAYLIITPDKSFVYGKRKLEFFNYKYMNNALRMMKPNLDDFFQYSLFIANAYALMSTFQYRVNSIKLFSFILITNVIVCNLLLIGLWIIPISLISRSEYSLILYEWCSYFYWIIITKVGYEFFNNWMFHIQSSHIIFSTIIFSCLIPRWLKNEYNGSFTSISRFMSTLYNVFFTINNNFHLEEDLMYHYITAPNLWLYVPTFDFGAIISNDYIKDLEYISYKPENDTDAEIVNSFCKKISKCPICLEYYCSGDSLCVLPCRHKYHEKCIVSWLKRGNHHCPICRWPTDQKKS